MNDHADDQIEDFQTTACPSAHGAPGVELVFCDQPHGHSGPHQATVDDGRTITWEHSEPAG